MRNVSCVLAVVVSVLISGCAHGPSGARTGSVPQRVKAGTPLQDPGTGTLLVQVLQKGSGESSESVAVLAYVRDRTARIIAVVGPLVTEEDWRDFYDSLSAFSAFRPGGNYCNGQHTLPCRSNRMEGARDLTVPGKTPKPSPVPPPPAAAYALSVSTNAATLEVNEGVADQVATKALDVDAAIQVPVGQ